MDYRLLSSFLPNGLLTYFDIVAFKELGDLQTKKDCFFIYLDGKSIVPKAYNSGCFFGFFPNIFASFSGIKIQKLAIKNNKKHN